MARPTDYNPSYIKIAQDYIDSCGREATELPTIEGLAMKLGCNDEQISIWASQPGHEEFSATIRQLKFKQKNQLINDGLYGGKEVNSPMAIFLLKANHGLVETTRTEVGGVLNANGEREPIKLFVNAGQGFIPAAVPLQQVSAGSVTELTPEIQGADLAPESTQDIHSNNGNSEAGAPA